MTDCPDPFIGLLSGAAGAPAESLQSAGEGNVSPIRPLLRLLGAEALQELNLARVVQIMGRDT